MHAGEQSISSSRCNQNHGKLAIAMMIEGSCHNYLKLLCSHSYRLAKILAMMIEDYVIILFSYLYIVSFM
jgi:hypothetical protein